MLFNPNFMQHETIMTHHQPRLFGVLLCVCAWFAFYGPLAHAAVFAPPATTTARPAALATKPVALVLAVSNAVELLAPPRPAGLGKPQPTKPIRPMTPLRPLRPLQVLLPNQTVTLGPKARLAIAVLGTGQRRVYLGPARLKVVAQHVSVVFGPKARVHGLDATHVDVIEQWLHTQVGHTGPAQQVINQANTQSPPDDDALRVLTPRDGAMLLHRNPEMEFAGSLPREGSLMIFDAQGKRFWTQLLEDHRVYFPSSVDFDWGQQFTWEVRKATGGKVAHGSFRIASQATARRLLLDKPADLPQTQPEFLLLYAMRLHLAQAYEEAAGWWARLGVK